MPAGAADAVPPGGQAPLPPPDLMTSLPAPVLRLLIVFAGPIAALRAVLEVLLWKPERRVQSWMFLLAWWFTCLSGAYVFAWLAPPLLFAPLLPLQRLRLGERKMPVQTTPARPATSETLLQTLGDVYKILALLPPSPLPPLSATYARFRALGARRLVRGLAVIWGLWIALDHTLGTRVLVALVGTGLILAPSPPLAQVVHLAGKSLAVRRTLALVFLLIFGSPDRDYRLGSPIGWLKSKWVSSRRPSTVLASKPVKAVDSPAPADRAGNPIYFRFELHENQRWWMGLDWTSALLPQERPSWCDSHLLPVAPPQAFALPAPSSIDLPAHTHTEPRGMLRRTATWRWLDDDWSVVKKVKGAPAPSDPTPVAPPAPVARPAPGLFSPSDGRSPSIAETAFAKGLGKLKSVPLPGTPASSSPAPAKASTDSRRQRTGSESTDASHEDVVSSAAGQPEGSIPEADDETDADGWVYGDNKWENMTARGGLGKFTRRRRWTRRAVCTESVHRIAGAQTSCDEVPESGSGAATPMARRSSGGVLRGPGSSPSKAGATTASSVTSDEHKEHRPIVAPVPAPSSIVPPARTSLDRDQQLKQRLKKAMGNMGA
ncbi:uncharacterized protein CcaverHIS019_0105280 [Cutaneotrichosporon cavernicola]|uniref:Peroxin/Ferlin domain-containing protein n=1 Tax=Cutaneotrichosporon cavernicola TaxID=279322 RepID=A0AA48I686_9TREE|nr:uncharacterized protein CcaverHIS019_0105280 [Cutaneotrichosporon cavernicola]BEI87810.1 hypothetical protein CcaverHIS019_0105280 [Cutaneotrichosporon cavernicola]BEI95584.1 hypothetical protein CcaverHIS631_0105330 [Cutaneotrichosporon cavernicola]BEJ03358.1 hypothetical protein CcaverHIS641_0105330 [Cutaneotrichosporon cavernicola]